MHHHAHRLFLFYENYARRQEMLLRRVRSYTSGLLRSVAGGSGCNSESVAPKPYCAKTTSRDLSPQIYFLTLAVETKADELI